jgi:hypothetical protein
MPTRMVVAVTPCVVLDDADAALFPMIPPTRTAINVAATRRLRFATMKCDP